MVINPNSNANDLFWLARYAHNTLAPLFNEAKAIVPTIQFHIELNFADADSAHNKYNSLNVASHWSRSDMFVHSICNQTKADIDQLAERVRADVDKLKAGAAA